MVDMIFPEESYRIIGACFEVYNELGPGFTGAVYQECLELELSERGIPFVPQSQLKLTYKGKKLSQVFIPDFFCFDKIIVEIKAASGLCGENRATGAQLPESHKAKVGDSCELRPSSRS
jgi:GxxExxY protein